MKSTRFAKAAFATVLALAVAGLLGCNQERKVTVAFLLERTPVEYRECAQEELPPLQHKMTWREVQLYIADARRKYGKKDRCLDGLIDWTDAQYAAYAKAYRAR